MTLTVLTPRLLFFAEKAANTPDNTQQKGNNLRTVDDLKAKIDEVTAVLSPLQSRIRRNEKRIRQIDMTLSRYETFCRLKPIHDEYMKKGFKRTKEKFQEAHKDKLDQYNAAYRYLLKNGAQKDGSRLQFSPEELKTERAQLVQENKNAQADIDAMSGEMKTLNTVRYYVSKVQPEPGKRKSVREMLKENQRKVAERESGKKSRKQDMEL